MFECVARVPLEYSTVQYSRTTMAARVPGAEAEGAEPDTVTVAPEPDVEAATHEVKDDECTATVVYSTLVQYGAMILYSTRTSN